VPSCWTAGYGQGSDRVLLVHRDHGRRRAPVVQRVAPTRPHARAVSPGGGGVRAALGVHARLSAGPGIRRSLPGPGPLHDALPHGRAPRRDAAGVPRPGGAPAGRGPVSPTPTVSAVGASGGDRHAGGAPGPRVGAVRPLPAQSRDLRGGARRHRGTARRTGPPRLGPARRGRRGHTPGRRPCSRRRGSPASGRSPPTDVSTTTAGTPATGPSRSRISTPILSRWLHDWASWCAALRRRRSGPWCSPVLFRPSLPGAGTGSTAPRDRPCRVPGDHSFTITLPVLPPVNRRLRASGACSRPSTRCSACLTLSSASHPTMSIWASRNRSR
jgi:hypothetical protein